MRPVVVPFTRNAVVPVTVILKGEFDGECVIFVDINAVCHKLN